MRLTHFGNYDIPQYNKTDVLTPGDSFGALILLPGGSLFDAFNDDRAPEDSVQVITSFELIATTTVALDTQRDAVRALRGRVARLWLALADNTWRWRWARCGTIEMKRERRFVFYQPVTLTFDLLPPVWHGHGYGDEWRFDSGKYFDAGLYFDMAGETVLTSTPQTVSAPNAGNRDVTDVVVTVTAGTSAITELTIGCGSCEWTYSGTIEAGKSLVVDCAQKSVLNDGASGYSGFSLTGNHARADWLLLTPGMNSVIVTRTGGGTGSTILLEYWDGWE